MTLRRAMPRRPACATRRSAWGRTIRCWASNCSPAATTRSARSCRRSAARSAVTSSTGRSARCPGRHLAPLALRGVRPPGAPRTRVVTAPVPAGDNLWAYFETGDAMRLLIQRVREASVTIGGVCCSRIGAGLLVFVGVGTEDTDEDLEYLAGKLVRLRIFDDEAGVMNLDLLQTGARCLSSASSRCRPPRARATVRVTSMRPPSPFRGRSTNASSSGSPRWSGNPSPRGVSALTCRWRWSMTGPSRSGWTRKRD